MFLGILSSFELFGDPFGFQLGGFDRAFLESVDGAGCVDQVLLAGIKRVAIRANFNMQLLFGGAGGESVAAGADYLGVCEIGWVEVVFHKLYDHSTILEINQALAKPARLC